VRTFIIPLVSRSSALCRYAAHVKDIPQAENAEALPSGHGCKRQQSTARWSHTHPGNSALSLCVPHMHPGTQRDQGRFANLLPLLPRPVTPKLYTDSATTHCDWSTAVRVLRAPTSNLKAADPGAP
jgi:hypothetical protein